MESVVDGLVEVGRHGHAADLEEQREHPRVEGGDRVVKGILPVVEEEEFEDDEDQEPDGHLEGEGREGRGTHMVGVVGDGLLGGVDGLVWSDQVEEVAEVVGVEATDDAVHSGLVILC